MKVCEYDGKIEDIRFPEGFLESLKDMTIEEQMDRYRVTYWTAFASTAYGELTREDIREGTDRGGSHEEEDT